MVNFFYFWKKPIELTNDNKIIELFRIHNNKLKYDISYEKNLSPKPEKKITKPSADNRKKELLNSSLVKRTAKLIDNSHEKHPEHGAELTNPTKTTNNKGKELKKSSVKGTTNINKEKPKSTQDLNKIRDLTTETIDLLLTKSTQIGQGATSVVYKVKNILTHKGYLCLKILNDSVIKKMNNDTNKEKKPKITWNDEDDDDDDIDHPKEEMEIDIDVVRQLLQEYEILNYIHHPNIVEVFGFYRGDSTHNPAILLEYCKYNLEQVVNEIDDIYLISIIYEICLAMSHVHQNKLIHRDLKMKNILVNSRKHVKICDFGIAKAVNLETLTSITHGVGTFAFMAPEVVKDNENYTEKVDVYSFGVVMYFVLTKGEMPKFTGVGKYIKNKMPSKINSLSQQLIKKCWSVQPNERPSFRSLIDIIIKNNFLLIDGIEDQIPLLKDHLINS